MGEKCLSIRSERERFVIVLAYAIVITVPTAGPIVQRSRRKKAVIMDEKIHLGMYLDQVGKILREIRLAGGFD